MSIDVYQYCPCGSGKKIKFCCCKDITAELDKALRMLEGEQRVACIEYLDKILPKHGDRDALLALKTIANLQLGQDEQAKEVLKVFRRQCPTNPVALALTALVMVPERGSQAGVEHLQRAIEQLENEIPPAVHEALAMMAHSFLGEGNVLAARAHFILLHEMSPEEDDRAATALVEIGVSRRIPLAIKGSLQFERFPADAPYRPQFAAAMEFAAIGAWLAAAERIEPLRAEHPDDACLLKALAVLRSCLGESDAACAALRKYASIEQLPLDDRIEAEMVAQVLDAKSHKNPPEGTFVDVVHRVYPTGDAGALTERLAEMKQLVNVTAPSGYRMPDDQPPPRSVYNILDREMPAETESLCADDIPRIIGQLLMFGKETDRDARIEVIFERYRDNDRQLEQLIKQSGGLIHTPPTADDVVDAYLASGLAASPKLRFPQGISASQRNRLSDEISRRGLLEDWPASPNVALAGKTPLEARDDPHLAVPLAANITLLEQDARQQRVPINFDELRSKLGMPLPGEIDPAEGDVRKIPLLRMHRVNAEKLDDEQLVELYARAMSHFAVSAIERLGHEVLRREQLAADLWFEEVCALLSEITSDLDVALERIQRAQEEAKKQNRSPGRWLVNELALRMRRQEDEHIERLFKEIRYRHGSEPDVLERLYALLSQLGLIGPDGQVIDSPQAMADAGASAAAPASGGADGEGGLWTPEGGSAAAQPAAAPSSGGESKLWVPGMD